nr:MAG TPA: hypothetical protein [Caudoviricetes sp.]
MNTFYTSFSVLKSFIHKEGLTIVNFSLIEQAADRVTIWVEDNDKGYTHFTCIKMSCTQFIIFGYNNNYEQILVTGYDFADVNTPPLLAEKE